MDEAVAPRRKSLLEHFSTIKDTREPCKVMYRLGEVLLLVVCGTMAACDDYDDIVLWGNNHLDFLRRLQPYDFGIPCADWLRVVMNRIGPDLFASCFLNFVAERLPEAVGQIAIDGKTSRRSHDRAQGKGPLHLVSAFATTSRLVLGQEAVESKSNELQAIPVLLERLAQDGGLKGALVSIDAIATNAKIAQAIKDAGADYLLAVKANQPTLRGETRDAFTAAEPAAIDLHIEHDKGHGRIERRSVGVIGDVDWLDADRRFPGELRLPGAACLIKVASRTELADRCRFETRYYISSARLSAEQAAQAVRGHWRIENQLHWVLDVVFKDDQSRLRKGHGAKNMAVVRHFAINLVRAAKDKHSLKLRRKAAGWDQAYLANLLGAIPR